MEDLENKDETIDRSVKAIASFFERLPEDTDSVFHIERQEIDRLIEQGVSVEDVCHEFVKRGFLLHGTGVANLDILEPRQANDEGGYEENLKNAIYATNDPRIPIFMGLISKVPGTSQYSISPGKLEDGQYTESVFFATTHDIPSNTVGYVYVLPKDTFEVAGSDSQFTSDVPVRPKVIMPILLSDFPYQIETIKE